MQTHREGSIHLECGLEERDWGNGNTKGIGGCTLSAEDGKAWDVRLDRRSSYALSKNLSGLQRTVPTVRSHTAPDILTQCCVWRKPIRKIRTWVRHKINIHAHLGYMAKQ